MLTIAMTFPAGRYHATPWGRHVNEADVEWPPSPWRLLRALLATWHRKGDQQRFSEAMLDRLLESLACEPPCFHIPPARQAHSRHYMPIPGNKTTLVFDAFAAVSPAEALIVHWPELELDAECTQLLDELLAKLGYLGRAESWVIARRLDESPADINVRAEQVGSAAEDGLASEPVKLTVPLSAASWQEVRAELLAREEIKGAKGRKGQNLHATLPEKLADALRLDTGDLQSVGWSAPPAARQIVYYRPYQALNSRIAPSNAFRTGAAPIQARLQLVGKPLPRVEDTVRITETFRAALIHTLDKRLGASVSPLISGHDLPEKNHHDHAFYLAEDMDGDGHIDHLLLYVPGGIDPDTQRALIRLERLWMRDGSEWRLLLDTTGHHLGQLSGSSRVWQSLTPYLHPWHRKKGFGVVEQIRKECGLRGLPEPEVEVLDSIDVGPGNRSRRPVHFHRFRGRRGISQPDRQGSFLRLSFPEEVRGPIALGFACHFGLGLFGIVEG
ncbi:type I-U CRISPR-associated protein Cas5/Cas6 [Marinobacterium sp. D7]|uniref:type I-G CRISPR-associated protein Csb2 n=1 Tax=Marinobacterium ramblicola TaxID=2849041 RepID=UPI001C2D0672|nr:type I-U CRISPR-associated protein Csb2 [Marinobacterium ramblicola]MBV1788006.1 type I-U CRISPR-associated protein Cas5/Cas6 [Marinobacterium ramblicola]